MMDGIRLIAITDTTQASEAHLLRRAADLCRICRAGSVLIQLRDRQLSVRDRLRLGEQLAHITRKHSQALSVNDRLDLAMALDADGLHLGETSVAASDIRGSVGSRFWLTRAAHDPDICQTGDADAILLSPVCRPRKGAPSLGFDALARATQSGQVAIFALGGVDASNAAECLAAGARGVATIGAWLTAESLAPLVSALKIARVSPI